MLSLTAVTDGYSFYPKAFEGCLGIVFSHDSPLGCWAVDGGNNNLVRAVSQKP